MGFTGSLITAAIIGGGASYGVSRMIGGKSQAMSSPQPLPQPPSPDVSADKARGIMKKKASMTQSIYTSPLGVAGEAQVARKQLLGQ